MVVERKRKDLRDVREGGDGIDIVKDGGKTVPYGLFGDVGDAGDVCVDRISPGESIALGADEKASISGV